MVAFPGGAPAAQLPARPAATASGSELASHRWRPIPLCVPGVTGAATGGKRRECASVSSDLSLGPYSLGGRPSSLMWRPRIGRRSLAAPAHGRAVWGAGGGGHGTPGDARRSGGHTKNPQRLPSGAPPTAGAKRGRDQPTESPPTRHVAPPSCGTVRIGRPSPWPTRGHRGGDCAGDGAAGGAWCVRRWECSEARTPRRVQPAAIQAPRAAPPQAAVRPLHAQLRGPVCGHLTLCPREAK